MLDKSVNIDLGNWPNCSVPDCPNKCCLALNSEKCHPHTTGKPAVIKDEILTTIDLSEVDFIDFYGL